jgi:signal transduction histidine kinase
VSLKDRLQEFSAASADIHEKTLQRIGAELHDGPAQALTFSLLQVDRLLRAIERNQLGDLKRVTTELRNVIHESAHEVRGISTGLALPELRAMSLREVVELAVHRHRIASGRTACIDFTSACEPTQSHKACIYRVVQESLTNAAKHSKAETLTVSVNDAGGLTIAISDDGRGFDKEQITNKGLGVLGMRSRVEALRGRFELSSSKDKGTTIIAHFNDPQYPLGGQHD